MATGSVRISVYWSYFKAAGGISFLILFFLSYVLMFSADVANSWWLMVWSGASEAPPCPGANVTLGNAAMFYTDSYGEGQINPSPFVATIMSLPTAGIKITGEAADPVDVMYYIKYYALFGFLTMLANNFNLVIQLVHGIRAARNLHSNLLKSVLGAPMRFFETTPIGRIINRFSKGKGSYLMIDINGCDMQVMAMIGAFVQCLFQIANIMIIVCAVTPLFFVFICPARLFTNLLTTSSCSLLLRRVCVS